MFLPLHSRAPSTCFRSRMPQSSIYNAHLVSQSTCRNRIDVFFFLFFFGVVPSSIFVGYQTLRAAMPPAAPCPRRRAARALEAGRCRGRGEKSTSRTQHAPSSLLPSRMKSRTVCARRDSPVESLAETVVKVYSPLTFSSITVFFSPDITRRRSAGS